MKIAHFQCPPSGNAGDTVITAATQSIFEHFHGPIKWTNLDFRKNPSLWEIHKCRSADAVLLGAGGLLNSDTNKSCSDWQWDIPIWKLKRLKKPLIVYAIGDNRFEGQELHGSFHEHFARTIQVSQFMGFRGIGSMAWIEEVFGKNLSYKLNYQPCPSLFYQPYDGERDKKHIGINLAEDRLRLRYKGEWQAFIRQFVDVAHALREEGYKVSLLSHTPYEAWSARLERQGFARIQMSGMSAEEVVSVYRQIGVVVGMRLHSLMLGFAQGCGIVGIPTHRKIRAFHSDIDYYQGIIEPGSDRFVERMLEKVRKAADDATLDYLSERKEVLWQITKRNHTAILAPLLEGLQ